MNMHRNLIRSDQQALHPQTDWMTKAFLLWRMQNYPYVGVDEQLEPFLDIETSKWSTDAKAGWLERSRMALLLPMATVAKAMGMSKAAYAVFEKNEKSGAITLRSLKKAAEAMNCELVYAIRPKPKISFAATIWRQIYPEVSHHNLLRTCLKNRKPWALAKLVRLKMLEPTFRRQRGWTSRLN